MRRSEIREDFRRTQDSFLRIEKTIGFFDALGAPCRFGGERFLSQWSKTSIISGVHAGNGNPPQRAHWWRIPYLQSVRRPEIPEDFRRTRRFSYAPKNPKEVSALLYYAVFPSTAGSTVSRKNAADVSGRTLKKLSSTETHTPS